MNQFIKGFNPSMAVNSYLNDDVEGEQIKIFGYEIVIEKESEKISKLSKQK